ncbi:MAG TPA: sialate O-acetylesterase, partial [Candidatus Methylacidiphilales bacterium]
MTSAPRTARRLLLALALTAGGTLPLQADVALPAIFGDHMVLQRNAKTPVWGTASPGEKVAVTLGSRRAETVAGADGAWRVDLPPQPRPEGDAPLEMTVAGNNAVTFRDVLLGDVWLCSGQSNMEFNLGGCHNRATAVPQANDPGLRFFVVKRKLSLRPEASLEGSWQICTPQTAAAFSGVGYFFGRALREAASTGKAPVGLIGNYWGGSTAQAWTSISGLEKPFPLQRYLDLYKANADHFDQLNDHYAERLAAYQADIKAWQTPENIAAEKAWGARLREARAAHQPDPPVDFPPKPREPPIPGGDQKGPANLYNGMIAPLVPYALKGIAWYQGEYNTDDPMEYYVLFPRLIGDWREKWGRPDLPFLFVQLPPLFNPANPA